MKEMKIGELASHTGLNAYAIRYYERCGLLAIPYRISGQRRYAAGVVPRVLLIRFASDLGFTLGQIKVFFNGLENRTAVVSFATARTKLVLPWSACA
jgi:DNA-binding transcriptional MerR regulator